jgi:hypothetical protein
LFSDVKLLFDCQKVTLFVFNKRIHEEIFDHITEDKHRFLHSVDFHDSMSVEKIQILGIARSDEELCGKLIYPSI